jgi:hypothetical protein
MSAKQQAIQDIRTELQGCNKAFIAFRTELNPVMRRIVKSYLKKQNEMK